MTGGPLESPLRRVRRRLITSGTLTAAAWALVAGIAVLLIGVWLDLLWELSPEYRIAAWIAAAVGGCALAAWALTALARRATFGAVARRMDQTVGGGQILTAWELDRAERYHAGDLSSGMAALAVDRAAHVAGGIPGSAVVPGKPLRRAMSALGLLPLGVLLLALLLPDVARTQLSRFLFPYRDVPPPSRTEFDVEPGDVKVLYGGSIDVLIRPRGAPVERVELVLVHEDGKEETLPAFPQPDGRHRATLARLTAPCEYFARAVRSRSRRYRIDIVTVPQIEKVHFRISPPAYTRDPAYEGPLPEGGIAELPGAVVEVHAVSNRPLSAGRIALDVGGQSQQIAMRPVASGAAEVVGQFEVAADGKFELSVIDDAGQPSQESFVATITLRTDQRPTVRLTQPQRHSLATPNVPLPVVLAAYDDFGVARAQLFRSLNGSRPLPVELPVDAPPGRRLARSRALPLRTYGLAPGDEIKLFARVEDNDPHGAKGAESGVVTVQIISQQQYEQMMRRRAGMKMLMSKYRQAQRRLDAMREQIKQLQKKLQQQARDGKVSEETRQEMQRTLRRLQRESRELRQAAEVELPYDIDKNLQQYLEAAAAALDEAADGLDKLGQQPDLLNEDLDKELAELLKQLEQASGEFKQNAMQPLEMVAEVIPLMIDQQRFIQLAQAQRELAERLKTFADPTGDDAEADTTRMDDLEQEQRALREQLTQLLSDIREHAEQLPDDPQWDELRGTALEFADDVEASGAAEAMSDAESALTELDGAEAYRKAKEAADILDKFISRCEGMCQGCQGALKFNPSLSECLGNSLQQLLSDMMGAGMGSGAGGGGGAGAGSGYSVRRGMGSQPNVGLYGGLPALLGMNSGRGSGDGRGDESSGAPQLHIGADPLAVDDRPPSAEATGAAEAAVPTRYLRRVGQYFQRVAEELQE